MFEKMKAKWMAKSTAEKINYVLDIILGIGGGVIGGVVGDECAKRAPGRIGRFCTKLTGMGVGMVAADLAGQELHRTTKVLGDTIDEYKARKASAAMKETATDERAE